VDVLSWRVFVTTLRVDVLHWRVNVADWRVNVLSWRGRVTSRRGGVLSWRVPVLSWRTGVLHWRGNVTRLPAPVLTWRVLVLSDYVIFSRLRKRFWVGDKMIKGFIEKVYGKKAPQVKTLLKNFAFGAFFLLLWRFPAICRKMSCISQI
jgi:hypothetical protein